MLKKFSSHNKQCKKCPLSSFAKTFMVLLLIHNSYMSWKTSFVSLKLSGIFFLLGFTPCNAEQSLQGMQLQEKETQKD